MQEAWLRWHNLDRHALREPQAWLTTVARRLAIDHRRAAALHAERLALLNAGGNTLAPAADDEAAQNEAVRKALVHIIRRLSPAETALVLLHEVFDADHADIAAAWRRSEPACRQALRRALQRVRRRDGPADPRDTCTESALLSLCLGALAARSAAPLFSLLREASIEAAARPLPGRVVRGPAVRTTLVQAGGDVGPSYLGRRGRGSRRALRSVIDPLIHAAARGRRSGTVWPVTVNVTANLAPGKPNQRVNAPS